MAKAKTKPETATTDADAAPTIKVQGIVFPVTPRYAEGHVLSNEEAKVLNQTLYENYRNNFAATIRTAREKLDEAAKAEGVDPRPFTAEEIAAFQEQFTAYANSYVFRAPRMGKPRMDPVEREMRAIAKERILAALAKKNLSSRSLAEGQMDAYIAQVIEKYPDVRGEAEARIAARNSVGADLLDL